ncbi:MAG TPA: hypothetical protein VGR53_03630 [Nitrososphaerales archaeon]|nr:hypothetical protein [Nitrososphaerales archaeon]
MAAPKVGAPPSVTGNTLRVYLYLLHAGESELRDVQRALGFTTPSLASYHLGKLISAGFVSQDNHGRYLVVKDSTSEILEGYVKLGTRVVPQLFFFAVLFSAIVGFFGFASLLNTQFVPLLVVSSLALVAVLWYETLRVWRRLTTWK